MAASPRAPPGVIRQVANGDTDIIARQHDAAIAAVTIEMIRSLPTRTGSRGRTMSVGGERVPIGPTKALTTDQQSRGFGTSWITRELGYTTTQFLGPDPGMVTRRVAEQVAGLHARTGDLTAKTRRTLNIPPLAELLAASRRMGELAGATKGAEMTIEMLTLRTHDGKPVQYPRPTQHRGSEWIAWLIAHSQTLVHEDQVRGGERRARIPGRPRGQERGIGTAALTRQG
ncbi:MAG TPA: hypothetical protein VF070_32325 [Streptosporangiaceae bacterium]